MADGMALTSVIISLSSVPELLINMEGMILFLQHSFQSTSPKTSYSIIKILVEMLVIPRKCFTFKVNVEELLI